MSWYTKMQDRVTNDDFINDAESDFELYLTESPNKKTVYKNGINIPIDVVIQEDSTATEKTDEIKLMLSKIDDVFNVGDIIAWGNTDWIVIWKDYKTIENNNKVKIIRCNNVLKYYDNDYILYTKSCSIINGRVALDEGRYITLASDEHVLYCRNETDTGHINLNTRFILSGDAYKVIGIDKISKVGLLEIKVKMDGIVNSDDRVDLGIANYVSNHPTYEVAILNGESAELFYQNTTLQLHVQVKRNGEIINNPVVTYTSSNTTVATVSSSGLITCKGTGDATITVNAYGVTDTIAIHGDIDIESIYTVTMTPIDMTIKTGMTMTLEAHAMNNGVEDLIRQFNWTLTNSDGSHNTYATITPTSVNNKNCILTAGSITNKYIVVRATLTNDPTKYIDKTIKIVNLF